MRQGRETLLYVETTSDEAVELIENRTTVIATRRLLESSTLTFEQMGEIQQALRDLERELTRDMRKTILQPDPIRVSKHLAGRIRDQIRKENPGL